MEKKPHAFECRGMGVLRESRWILRDLSCEVPAGKLTVLLGPNGSGKSTLTRIIGGHLFPTAGSAHILGHRIGATDLRALRRDIRLVQPAGPYDVDPELTTHEVVLTGFFSTLALYDEITDAMRNRATDAIGRVGLMKVMDNPYRTLSSGEKMRSLIARALVADPKLLLLDEPTAALDMLSREQVLATIHALHEGAQSSAHTTLMITHHIDEIPPNTAHVILLHEGTVAAAGRPEDVLKADIMSRVYNCPLTIRHSGNRYYAEVSTESWKSLMG